MTKKILIIYLLLGIIHYTLPTFINYLGGLPFMLGHYGILGFFPSSLSFRGGTYSPFIYDSILFLIVLMTSAIGLFVSKINNFYVTKLKLFTFSILYSLILFIISFGVLFYLYSVYAVGLIAIPLYIFATNVIIITLVNLFRLQIKNKTV